ncbi:unnamed protein product [Mycena citricolor]|uniref:GXWXG domain-containing protein n=1 Tax=Mycena citricolor TaxID=2018698 RepID=A0AAD2H6Y0_9AGAR|nr:unnamed protein product [Mycena citricolor]
MSPPDSRSPPPPSSAAETAYLSLMRAAPSSADRRTLKPETLDDIYAQLRTVEPGFLIGEWTGGDFPELGHPVSASLTQIRWAGKSFYSAEDVVPIVVYDAQGSRTPALEPYGKARIREVKFRGVVSAAMVYDILAIIDHFRYVDENTVAGVMDTKDAPPGYHFYLKRLDAKSRL